MWRSLTTSVAKPPDAAPLMRFPPLALDCFRLLSRCTVAPQLGLSGGRPRVPEVVPSLIPFQGPAFLDEENVG
eukprot:11690471-Heterocapsa_arctica.AAC.1